jgi:hypothetical protein
MGLAILGRRREPRTRRTSWLGKSPKLDVSICDVENAREKAYRFIVRDVVWDLGAIHDIGQRILLQSRLGRIGDGTRSQTHDAIAKLESCNTISDLAHDSDDIFAEDGRQFVCDQQAGVSAPLIVRVKSWCSTLAIHSIVMNANLMYPLVSASIRLTSDGHFDLDLTVSRLQNRMIVNKDKRLANFLDEKSSLCRHLDLVFLNEVEMSLGAVE